jgi:predicted nucleic acid-binding protein
MVRSAVEVPDPIQRELLDVPAKEPGRGEAEVIVLAVQQNIGWVTLDDRDARRFARRNGLGVIGTPGSLPGGRARILPRV